MKLALAFLTLSLGACHLAEVDATVDETCATYHGLTVDAAPVGVQQAIAAHHEFEVTGLDAFGSLADEGFTLTVTRAQARAMSGITSFDFVQDAHVTVASSDPDSTLPTVDVLHCDSCGSESKKFDIQVATDVDAAAYVETGSIIVDLALSGHAPAVAWSMDVDVCMSGSLSVTEDLGDLQQP
jgi:hypothetical protein